MKQSMDHKIKNSHNMAEYQKMQKRKNIQSKRLNN